MKNDELKYLIIKNKMTEYKNDIFAHKINGIIKQTDKEQETFDINNISDLYHTFWELYKHRTHLFIALCKQIDDSNKVYPWLISILKSKLHSDWTWFDWWFIIQLETTEWQISYHLSDDYWDKCDFIETVEKANEWDWHTSDDVLERLLLI